MVWCGAKLHFSLVQVNIENIRNIQESFPFHSGIVFQNDMRQAWNQSQNSNLLTFMIVLTYAGAVCAYKHTSHPTGRRANEASCLRQQNLHLIACLEN